MVRLDGVRKPKKRGSPGRAGLLVLGCLLLGAALGTFAKFLDYRQGSLPAVLQRLDGALDLHNFLGGFAPWLFLALCIAVYSAAPWHGAANAFAFFAGMVSAYYLYSYFVAGFFPKNYAMLWVALTVASPFLAWLCWYAKGSGPLALLLSAGVVGVFLDMAFSWGWWYLDLRSWLNAGLLLLTLVVLRRRPKQMVVMVLVGVGVAVLLDGILPFRLW